MVPRCTVCNAPRASPCADCKSIWYCSYKCKNEDSRFVFVLPYQFASSSTGSGVTLAGEFRGEDIAQTDISFMFALKMSQGTAPDSGRLSKSENPTNFSLRELVNTHGPNRRTNSMNRLHNMICSEFSKLSTDNPRSSTGAVLAMMLSPDSNLPHLVWVEGGDFANMKIVKMGEYFDKPTYHAYLGSGEYGVEEMRISEYGNRSLTGLPDTIALHCREKFLPYGSNTNQCVAETSNRQHRNRWCGPIVLASWVGRSSEPEEDGFQDVAASDLHYAVNFFKSYGDL